MFWHKLKHLFQKKKIFRLFLKLAISFLHIFGLIGSHYLFDAKSYLKPDTLTYCLLKRLMFYSIEYFDIGQRCPTFLSIGHILETKSLGGHILDLKIKIWDRIAFFKDIKGTFSIQITFCKGPAGILKSLGGQKNARGH